MGEQFDYQSKILEYIKDKKKPEAPIIGLYMKAKNMRPENQEQINSIFRRNVRSAKELTCYSNDKLIGAMKYLIDNADYKWTLESVLKCIDEDFNQLEGKKPIINLSNGEQIYSAERIKQLEREGRVYYTGSKWREIVAG